MDENKLEKLIHDATILSRERKLDEAIAKWNEIIPLLQNGDLKVVSYNRRGIAKRRMGNHADAIADYNSALEINPNHAKAYCNRGIAKRHMGDYASAIADYDSALEISPNYAKAYNHRGFAKSRMGDYVSAIADYDSALEINPNYANAYCNRDIAKRRMGDHASAKMSEVNSQCANRNIGKSGGNGHVESSAQALGSDEDGEPTIYEKIQWWGKPIVERLDRIAARFAWIAVWCERIAAWCDRIAAWWDRIATWLDRFF